MFMYLTHQIVVQPLKMLDFVQPITVLLSLVITAAVALLVKAGFDRFDRNAVQVRAERQALTAGRCGRR